MWGDLGNVLAQRTLFPLLLPIRLCQRRRAAAMAGENMCAAASAFSAVLIRSRQGRNLGDDENSRQIAAPARIVNLVWSYTVHLGYWLQFWWMFPIALGICITV